MSAISKSPASGRCLRHTASLFFVALAVLAGTFCAIQAHAAGSKEEPLPRLDPSRTLHVSVEPAVTDAFTWTEVIDLRFFNEIARALRQAHYKGEIVQVLRGDEPPEGAQHLKVTLYRWRELNGNSVEATITGALDPGDGKLHSLGVSSGVASNAISLDEAYFQAARKATRNLYGRIAPPKKGS